VAGRFPVLTDACVNEHLVQALRDRGRDVARAIDLCPEKTKDQVLFARAAADDRVFVTNGRPAEAIAIQWLQEGRRFRGMVAWPVETYEHRNIGDLVLSWATISLPPDRLAARAPHGSARRLFHASACGATRRHRAGESAA
jgi:hypothetical protein